jgi:hypothetical protein
MASEFPRKLPKKWIEEIERNGRVGSLVHGLKVVGKDDRGVIVHLGKDSFKILHNGRNQNVFGNPLIGGIDPVFGYQTIGSSVFSIVNAIYGSVYTMGSETGQVAVSITVALVSSSVEEATYTKCAIYRHSDSTLVGSTEEKLITYTATPTWNTFNFPDPKPSLSASTDYVLVAWAKSSANNIARITYDAGETNQGHYKLQTYDAWPTTISFNHVNTKASIYCTYTSAPALITVTDSVGLSDAVLCHKSLAVTDSVGLADTPLKGWTPTVTDAVTLVETVLRNKAFSILDSVGLADVVYRGKQLTLTDAVSLTDAILRNKQFAVQDVLGLADAVLSHKQLQVSDTVSLADVALAIKFLLLTDSISLSDAVSVYVGAILKVVEDSIGLSDAVYRNKALIISDTVSVLDQIFRNKPLVSISDVLTLAEVVAVSKVFAVVDSVSLSDVAKVLKQLRVIDSVALTDAAQIPSKILKVLDSIGLSDVAKVDKALIVSDQIALVEVVYAFLPVKKTKLFLIVGNLAIQLTGD